MPAPALPSRSWELQNKSWELQNSSQELLGAPGSSWELPRSFLRASWELLGRIQAAHKQLLVLPGSFWCSP